MLATLVWQTFTCIVLVQLARAKGSDLSVCKRGDLVIGAFFTIGKNGGDKLNVCVGDLNEYLIVRAQSMLDSVQQANEKILRSTGVTLGLIGYESCDNDNVISDHLQNDFSLKRSDDENCTFETNQTTDPHYTIWQSCGDGDSAKQARMLVLSGAIYSQLATKRSDKGYSTCIPVLSSYLTTTMITQLKNTLTTWPLNDVEARAIVALLYGMNVSDVTIVSITSENQNFAGNLAKKIEYILKKLNEHAECSHQITPHEFNNIGNELDAPSRENFIIDGLVGEAVVVVGDHSETEQFFRRLANELEANGTISASWKFILVDGVADVLVPEDRKIGELMDGALGVTGEHLDATVSEGFERRIGAITLSESCSHNPWLAKLIAKQQNCSYVCAHGTISFSIGAEGTLRSCNGNESVGLGAQGRAAIRDAQFDNVAVWTVALAVQKLHERYCGRAREVCERLLRVSGNELFEVMYNAKTCSTPSAIQDPSCFYDARRSGKDRSIRIVQLSHSNATRKLEWNRLGAFNGDENLTCKNIAERLGNITLPKGVRGSWAKSSAPPIDSFKNGMVVVSVLVVLTVIVVVAFALQLLRRRQHIFPAADVHLRDIGPGSRSEDDILNFIEPHYRIKSADLQLDGTRLGKGFFGEVNRGELDEGNRRSKVAIKRLLSTHEHDPQLRESLKSELKFMQSVGKHINLLAFRGATCNVLTGQLNIVTEYCPFGNIGDFLRKRKEVFHNLFASATVNEYRASNSTDDLSTSYNFETESTVPTTWKLDSSELSTSDLCCFAYQIACGMNYLSSKGVIHRDLRACNILIDANFVVKVGDFGLSRQTDYYSLTGCPIPTRWMPLEVLFGHGFTTKSDVWSFGVLLWEVFTLGARPYDELVETEFLQFCLRDQLQAGARLMQPQFANDEIYGLMKRCWYSNVIDRPTFQECKLQLGALLHSEFEQVFNAWTRFEFEQSISFCV